MSEMPPVKLVTVFYWTYACRLDCINPAQAGAASTLFLEVPGRREGSVWMLGPNLPNAMSE
jgi:hypothetical protein